jgi:hypothetical protein
VVFEQAPSFAGQANRVFAGTWHTDALHQALFAQVTQVAGTRIERTIMMVCEVTTGDHSKRADGCQRTRLGATQRVLAITIAHEFSVASARQIEVTRERLAWIEHAVAWIAGAIWPAGVVARISGMFAGVRFARVTGPAAELSCVIVLA